ncbi:glutamate receptor 2.9-like [Populus alba x Populus x berolinensis]|uniref:Glutamate receptor n=1 Tax=Populus alba x Populus x berolinensis TaxID=444605 RepID=A0AAD6RSY8_9ROSI|nr:glutamate receptor 2.9-like [Populus alba x Populus x berolinensis]
MGTLPHAFSLFALILLLTSGTGADQSTKTQAIFKGSTGIGAIVDTSSRIGKEEIVAMEVAKEDFYGFGNLTFLLINDSQKDTIHAALEAKDLIDTRQVQAIIGPQTWEEVSLVAEIARETQVPILSFADTAPEWATGRWPSLLQASPDKRAQMKAVAAIVQSWNWHQVIVIYEDTDSSARGVIPHLHDALREVNSQVSQFVAFSPSASSDSMSKELENIKSKQYCRVFVVHLSFKLAVRLFEMAKKMEMMQKDYVWITTDPITSLVHSFNASVISSMKGILGVRSYYPKMGQDFENFKQRFRTSFSRKYPREEKKEPGIYAVQAYDAMRTIALGLNKTGSKRGGKELLENILDADFPGLSGKVKFKNHNVAAAEIFEIVNVIGTGYNEIGYWSNGFGFSEKIHENSRYNSSSMIDLEQVHWPGGPRYTPRGWTTLRSAKLFRIGVPSFSGYEEYVKVESDDRLGTNSSGFANEVFKATTASMPFFLPYEFQYFNGSYNELVEQLHLKNFDAAVGDVEIVASRHQYAEFTYPFTETGLVLIVPVRSSSKAWSFIKPFTTTMWVLISVITVYNGFVVWWIERKHCDELQGSITTQIGIMIWLSFNTLFSLNGPKLHSNLSRMSGVVWLFVALIIIQTYTANLTSMLTVQRLEPTIPTVEELLNSNEKVGYCTDSYTERYLLEVLKFKNQNIQHFQSAESYAQGFEDKKISAAFLGIPSAKKFLAKYCNSFIQIGPTYKIGGFGLAFPRGSPLLASVNEALLSLSEKGALQELEKTWITPQKCTKMPSDDSLGPSGFRELFFITGGTTTIAFVIYVCRTNLLRHKNIWGIISAVLKRWVSPRRHFTRRVANVEISLPEIHLKPVELSTE